MVMAGVGRALVRAGTLSACALAVHTAVNLRYLRSPDPHAPVVDEDVTVLIPARDEAAHIEAALHSVLTQTGVPRLNVIVLDDGSTDDTPAIVERIAARDARLRLVSGRDDAPPAGWLGKPWACQRLADEASGTVLVFVDADVMIYPHAIRAAVGTLRHNGFSLVAPYPPQLAGSALERLVQPLVTWSWAATLPLRWAEGRSRDTRENAALSMAMLKADGVKTLVLVTHDLHMPRAERAFVAIAAGQVTIVAAPVGLQHDAMSELGDWMPSGEGLTRVRYAVYEWLALRAGH